MANTPIHEQFPDDETCLEALCPLRWPSGFVGPELDESYLGGASRGSRGALSKRLLRHLQEFSYGFARRAKGDEFFRFVLGRVTQAPPLRYGQLNAKMVG